jgi:two-component sensor histidine kinase
MARDIETLLRQQAALALFGTFAFQESDLMKTLDEAARICADSLGAGYCKVCRYRPEQDDLLIEAGFGWQDGVIGKVVSQADESSPQGRAFITGEPVIVRNLRDANGYQPPTFYAQHGIVSTVDVLIKAHTGPPFGVLEVDSTDEQSYDEHDINFLTGFANVLAEAVATSNRSRLLQETLAHMQELVVEKDHLLDERNVLARELQHRVRNNLQLINGMLNDQLKQTSDEAGQRGLRSIIRRVMSLAQVYDHLLGIGMSDVLDFGAYTTSLCVNLPDLQPVPDFPVKLVCEAVELNLDLAAVTAVGLVVAELVSNSYEHAFSRWGGTIDVQVMHDLASGRGVVTIRDDGVGYKPAPEARRHGIGLARRLMQQVGGTLDVDGSNGTLWTLQFPVEPSIPVLITGTT